MKISLQEAFREGSWDQCLWEGREARGGSRIGKREELSCSAVSTKASADPLRGGSGAPAAIRANS